MPARDGGARDGETSTFTSRPCYQTPMTLAPRRPLGKMADDPLAAMAAYVEQEFRRRHTGPMHRVIEATSMGDVLPRFLCSCGAETLLEEGERWPRRRRCAYCGGPEPVLPTRTCPGCGAAEWERANA